MAGSRLRSAFALLASSALCLPCRADEGTGNVSESNETEDLIAPYNNTMLALPSSPLGLFERDVEGQRGTRISGGVPAPTGYKYHTQVQVMSKQGTSSCGAALVGERHLLTAAHCVTDKSVRAIVAWVGVDHVNDLAYSDALVVKEFIVHPAYRGTLGGYDEDIAILVLEKAVSEDFVAARFALASAAYYAVLDPTSGVICGLGFSGPESTPSRVQCAALPISQGSGGAKCRVAGVDTGRMICSIISGTGATCSGDSGSGIYQEHESNRLTLLGLTSFGTMKQEDSLGRPAATCPSGKALAAFFTKMPVVLKWVNSYVRDLLVVDGCGSVVRGAAFFASAQVDRSGCVTSGEAVDPVAADFSPDPDVIFPYDPDGTDTRAVVPGAGLALALTAIIDVLQA